MEMTVIKNTLYAHVELWTDPSCPSIPNRMSPYWEVYFGGEYSFLTDQTEDQLENDLYDGFMNDMVNEDCDVKQGLVLDLEYTLKGGVCTIKIVDAEYEPEDIGDYL